MTGVAWAWIGTAWHGYGLAGVVLGDTRRHAHLVRFKDPTGRNAVRC